MDVLQSGFARRVITPRVPASLAGYFTLRPWDRVLDDLYVQALAVGDAAGVKAVLVQMDLVSAGIEVVSAVRKRCADIPGLEEQHLVFTASHTHTAPEIRPHRQGGNPAYTAEVVAQTVDAVHAAVADLAPTTAAAGLARDDRFAFNRRYWMRDGSVVTNPPRRHPDILRPEGATDPEIPLLRLRRGDRPDVLLASICNHADTISGTGVSADWHGFVRRRLESADPRLRVMTLTGCAGNLNHFDPAGPDEQSGYAVAKRIGTGYAESIAAVLGRLSPLRSGRVGAMAATLTVGPREISPEELAEAREHAARYTFEAQGQLTSEDLANRSPAALKYFADRLIELAEDRAERTFEVHAMRLGEAVLVALPGEPFTEHGLAIRHTMAAGAPCLIATLADSRATYIPNRENYGRGGYETAPRSSPYAMETGNLLRETVRDLLSR